MDDYSSDSKFEVVVDDEPPHSASDGSSKATNESMGGDDISCSITAGQEFRDEKMNQCGGGLVMHVRKRKRPSPGCSRLAVC